jgi:hypothetical protein
LTTFSTDGFHSATKSTDTILPFTPIIVPAAYSQLRTPITHSAAQALNVVNGKSISAMIYLSSFHVPAPTQFSGVFKLFPRSNTDPVLANIVIDGLFPWILQPTHPSVKLKQWSRTWTHLQTDYLQMTNSTFTLQNHCTFWLSSIVQVIWTHCYDEWIHPNNFSWPQPGNKDPSPDNKCPLQKLELDNGSVRLQKNISRERRTLDIWKIGFH